MAWTHYTAVSHYLHLGLNDPQVPWLVGAYRFRVKESHPTRAGEVVYVGRAATMKSSAICRRVGQFVMSAMGFYDTHSGGNYFFETRRQHGLSAHDLDVAWIVDPDPWCAEASEYYSYPLPPAFCRKPPSTCADPNCIRARGIFSSVGRW